jgi:hypothetical protein
MADIEHEHWVCRNCESVDGPTVEGDCALCREDSVQSPVVALVPADQLGGPWRRWPRRMSVATGRTRLG